MREFRISLTVGEVHLYNLLAALPNFKVGDLQIHAVPEPILALPAHRRAGMRKKFFESMAEGPKTRGQIQSFTGQTMRGVEMMIFSFRKQKLIRSPAKGVYELTEKAKSNVEAL